MSKLVSLVFVLFITGCGEPIHAIVQEVGQCTNATWNSPSVCSVKLNNGEITLCYAPVMVGMEVIKKPTMNIYKPNFRGE